jgi:hypothetical protein
MPIQFRCPKCDKPVRAPDNLAGRKVKCPQCAAVVQVPTGEEPEEKPQVRAAEPRGGRVRSEPGEGMQERPQPKARPNRDDMDEDIGDRRRDRIDDDDDMDDAPPRKKQEGRTLNVLGLISIFAAILGGAIGLLPCGIGFISLPITFCAFVLGVVGLILAGSKGQWGFITPTVGTVLSIIAAAVPVVTCIAPGAMAIFRVKQAVNEVQEEIEKQQREVKENLEKGDKLWDEGKKAEAVKLYKDNVNRIPFTSISDKDEKFQRIVDFEASQGHDGEARHWIQIAINEGRTPNYETDKAKQLYKEITRPQIPGTSSSSKGSNPPGSSVAAGPDVDLTVDEYVQAIGKAAESDKVYHDRFINITGTLGWYGRMLPAQGSKSYFLFEGFQDRFNCPEDKLPSKALPGQTVVLRGKWTHPIFGVENWTFVKASGDGPPEVKAEDLLKELSENLAEAKRRWADKIIVVSGKIQDLPKGGINFAPPGKEPRLICWFYDQSLTTPTGRIKFQKGQQVKLVGKFEELSGQVGICELIELK